LEIIPSKIIKGQELDKMLTKINQESIKMGEKEQIDVFISEIEDDEWYSHIIYYLKNLNCPDHLFHHRRRALKIKAMKYCLMWAGLRWRNLNGVILK
jgi:hypothetical protein